MDNAFKADTRSDRINFREESQTLAGHADTNLWPKSAREARSRAGRIFTLWAIRVKVKVRNFYSRQKGTPATHPSNTLLRHCPSMQSLAHWPKLSDWLRTTLPCLLHDVPSPPLAKEAKRPSVL